MAKFTADIISQNPVGHSSVGCDASGHGIRVQNQEMTLRARKLDSGGARLL